MMLYLYIHNANNFSNTAENDEKCSFVASSLFILYRTLYAKLNCVVKTSSITRKYDHLDMTLTNSRSCVAYDRLLCNRYRLLLTGTSGSDICLISGGSF